MKRLQKQRKKKLVREPKKAKKKQHQHQQIATFELSLPLESQRFSLWQYLVLFLGYKFKVNIFNGRNSL